MDKKQGIFLREINAESTDAVIDIVGVIGWEVWYPEMKKILQAIPETVGRVVFDIYSPGGDVWDGNAIIQEIGALKQKTVARVQVAASMATLIAVACDEREIAGNGRWLIHNPWTATQGDAEAHEKRAKELRDCEKEAVRFYADRTKKSQKEIKELMAEERWLTPKETLEFGFVQKINDPFDANAYAEVKADIVAAGEWPQGLVEIPEQPEQPEPPQEQQEIVEDENENPTGAEVKPDEAVDVPDVPQDEVKPEDLSGYSVGFETGSKLASERMQALTADMAALKKECEKRDELIRKMQSEKDRLGAEVKALKCSLDESNNQIGKLLEGGMTFSPAIETWEEAMEASGNDYAKARATFPEVYRMRREMDKQKRNGGK